MSRYLRNIVLFVVAFIAVFALCFAAFFVPSALRARDLGNDLSESYRQLDAAVQSGNAEAISQTARTIADQSSDLASETESRYWDIAASLPLIGDDAASVRTLASVAEDVSCGVVSPVAADYAALIGSSKSQNPLATLGNATSTQTLATDVDHARKVVAESADRVSALPAARTSAVRNAVASTEEALAQADDELAATSSLIAGARAFGSAASSMMSR